MSMTWFVGHLGKPILKLRDICVVVELELPEGDEGEEEYWEEGEQGVRHALTPNRTELVMMMLMMMILMMMMMRIRMMMMRIRMMIKMQETVARNNLD